MHAWAIPVLRSALGVVFIWFGALKLAGVSPVEDLLSETYWFFETDRFLLILGGFEVLIGAGLLLRKALRFTLGLLWLQMAGTFGALFLSPHLFFNGSFFMLTTEGEFIVKNFVLIASGLVIGGYEVTIPLRTKNQEQPERS